MKGYWHIPGIAAVLSIIQVTVKVNWPILVFLLWLFYLYYRTRIGKWPIIISLSAFIFYSLHLPEVEINFSNEEPVVGVHEGKASGSMAVTSGKVEFQMTLKDGREVMAVYFVNGKDTAAYLKANPPDVSHGANCKVEGSLELPPDSSNPAQFSYRDYLLKNKITHQLIISSPEAINCVGSSFLSRFHHLRDRMIYHTEERLGSYTAAWLNAVVLGDKSGIEESTIDVFQRWSLSHIIAISGTHVGLLGAFLYFILIKLNVTTREKAQGFMFFFLPVYAILAGGEPSIWRAAVMMMAFIILHKLKVRFSYSDIISLVFLLLMLLDGHIIYHIGFQFSFLVAFSILISRRWLTQSGSAIWQVIKISMVAQLAIIPLQLTYFYIFQPLSIILNILVIPYFTLVMIPLMYVFLPLSLLPAGFVMGLSRIFEQLHSRVLNFVHYADEHYFYPFLMDGMPGWAIAVYVALFVSFMRYLEMEKKSSAFQSGILLCLLIIGLACRPYLSPVGTVTMFDIGQGDAILVELPYREGVIMIDAGANFSFEDMEPTDRVFIQVLRPYFYARGIQEIDALILSHEDIDHTGSVRYLAGNMWVKEIITSDYFVRDVLDGGEHLEHTRLRNVKAGDRISIGSQDFHVLGPMEDRKSANENSLILLAEIGGLIWMFTGDITSKEERDLVKRFPTLGIDVLKVAHHGSATSTDRNFVEAVEPHIALIPVGRNNRYGHPVQDVIESLERQNTLIYRTDIHGAIQFRFVDDKGTFSHYLP